MSWFHFNKQERIKRNRELRREAAEAARKEASENAFLIRQRVDEALKLAIDEERLFTDYFTEPMPNHVLSALHLEILLWRRIQAGIERAHKVELTDVTYNAFQDGVRALLLCLINLLHAEEEMITSCLVRHYLNIAQAVQAEAARVTL